MANLFSGCPHMYMHASVAVARSPPVAEENADVRMLTSTIIVDIMVALGRMHLSADLMPHIDEHHSIVRTIVADGDSLTRKV